MLVFSADGSAAVAAAAASHEGVAVVPAPAPMRKMAPLALKYALYESVLIATGWPPSLGTDCDRMASLIRYALYESVLRLGCSALFADVHVNWSDSPFGYLSRDTDIEATSTTDGFMRTGRVVSVDDAQMGWSRSANDL